MLSLHTNAAALSAQNAISKTQQSLSQSMTRLSTGYRVNSAMDDAAGLQIATRLKAQTSGMATAARNTQNSISLLQTAEGSFDEVNNMLVRMKDLATQSADASSTDDDRVALQAEYDALGLELANIMKNTTFGGQTLLEGGTVASAMDFQIGASSAEKMTIDLNADMLQLTGTDLVAVTTNYSAAAPGAEVTTQLSASGIIDTINDAIDSVGKVRSALGAAANRLDHVATNLANVSTNTKNATGRIMDVDFASESAAMTSNQMLLQAGTAMLKQSNSQSSLVLSLLQ